MDEGELWIRMLETIGRHASALAIELRALRAQLGDTAATRGGESTPDTDPGDPVQ